MNWRAIAAIVRRDLTLVARARAVVMPLIVVPLLFFIVFPVLATLAVRAGGDVMAEFEPLLDVLPPQVVENLGPGPIGRQVLVYLFEYSLRRSS